MLSAFLIAHGSALILPLAVIEGPVVAIVTGVLAAQGYFSWYGVLPLLIGADLTGDVICYWIGRTGTFLRRRSCMTPAFQQRLVRNATKMLLIGKWTHTLGGLVLVGSGMLRVPLPRFILVNLIATVPKSALLFGFGYFAGDHYVLLERHVILATIVLSAVGMASFALIFRRTDSEWVGR